MSKSPGDNLDAFLSMILDHSKSEIAKSVRAGRIDLGQEKLLQERGLILGRRWMRLSPARADAFIARLKEVQKEFEVPQPDEPDAIFYEFPIGMYPTEPPTQ